MENKNHEELLNALYYNAGFMGVKFIAKIRHFLNLT